MKNQTKNNFIRMFLLLLAVVSTLFLTACGGGGGSGDDDDNKLNSKNLVGNWVTTDDTPFFETLDFYNDGSVKASLPEEFYDNSRLSIELKGKWHIADEILYMDFDNDTYSFSGSLDNGCLKITVTIKGEKDSFVLSFQKQGKAKDPSIIGTWYHNLEDGIPVKGDKIPSITIKSDGSCSIIDYEDCNYDSERGYWVYEGNKETINGKWVLSGKTLKVTVDGYTTNIAVTSDSLTISGEYEDGSGTWTSVYKKTKYADSNSSYGGGSPTGNTGSESILGTWYHNLEDGKPVKGSKIPTITFKSDGSCTIVDYDGMYYDSQKGYWECSGNSVTITGKWSLSGSTLKVTVDGYTTSIKVSSDSLTISGNYEDGSGTWTSVYKKTKYAN